MVRWGVRLFALILASVLPAAHAQKRVALVVANAAYKNAAILQNLRNDAADVAETPRRLSLATIVGFDLDKGRISAPGRTCEASFLSHLLLTGRG
jgi:hypothetical protein